MSHRVLILKTKATSLKQAEQFLRNRQWQIISTTSLRDAIAAVVQKQPEFIMIAADHPNRKVRVLPKLMGQAITGKVIGFVEASTNASMAILHEMGLEYNVFPPVSGPAIERIILKIKKDDEKKELDKQRAIENGTYLQDRETSSKATPTGESFSSAREMLAKLANGDEDSTAEDGTATSGLPAADADSVITQKGMGPGELYTYSPNSNPAQARMAGMERTATDHEIDPATGLPRQNDEDSGSWIPSEGKATGKGASPGSSAGRDREASKKQDEPGSFENPYASSWDTDSEDNPRAGNTTTPSPKSDAGGLDALGEKSQVNPNDHSSDSNAPGAGGSRASRRANNHPIMEHGPFESTKKRKGTTYKQDPSLYPDRDSIIVKGTQTALDESVIRLESEDFVEVKSATNVACITISSPRFSGYLVAALGADRRIDDDFIKTVQSRLFSFLRANGEVIDNEEGMGLKLEQVEFEDWAISQAAFLRKSIHGTDEIAMAFFPSKETSSKLEESVSKNMLKLGIDELKDDVPVEFDLYIYLPSNQKYVLYTPQGGKLFGQQRGRLRNKGVTHVHLRKDSASQAKRYRAQVYLNEKINEFQKKKKAG